MMLCYKDRTFCSANCANEKCSVLFTEKVEKDAAKFGLPVACSDFSDSCDDYIEKKVEE